MRQLIKEIIYGNDLLFNLYYRFFFRSHDKLGKFLDQYSRSIKEGLRFIQIGANNGKWDDPLYKYIRRDKWEGILVEPQKDVFEKLKYNYRKLPMLIFENVAIDEQSGTRSLYRISFSNSSWATGLSSFNREDIQRMIDAGYVERMASEDKIILPATRDSWIISENVTTLCLNDLVNKYKYSKIDLLMLDVEGYEFEILKTIPFNNLQISVIIYEQTHFSDSKKAEIEDFLFGKGYNISEMGSDSIAYINQILKPVSFN